MSISTIFNSLPQLQFLNGQLTSLWFWVITSKPTTPSPAMPRARQSTHWRWGWNAAEEVFVEFFVSLITVIYLDNVSHNECGLQTLHWTRAQFLVLGSHKKISSAHASNVTICPRLYAGLVERFFACSHYITNILMINVLSVIVFGLCVYRKWCPIAFLPSFPLFFVTAQTDNNEFLVDKSVTVVSPGSTGTQATVEVTYEPTRVGESSATLLIASATGAPHIPT